MLTLCVTSKSPLMLLSPPLNTGFMPNVPLSAKMIVSVPALAFAWPMAQRKLPGMGMMPRNRSLVVVTV